MLLTGRRDQARAEIDVGRHYVMQVRRRHGPVYVPMRRGHRDVIGDHGTRQRCGRLALRKHRQRADGRVCRNGGRNRAALRLGTVRFGADPWRSEAKFGDRALKQRLDGGLAIGMRPWRRVEFPAPHGVGRAATMAADARIRARSFRYPRQSRSGAVGRPHRGRAARGIYCDLMQATGKGRTWVYERLRQFADAGRVIQTHTQSLAGRRAAR